MRILWVICAVGFSLAFPAWLEAATLHVDGVNGDDARSGLSLANAWRTIQHAADVVNPGDTVLIEPGVYFEHVAVTRTGTAAQPIRFRAAGPGVIVSGAQPAIRAGQTAWAVESGAPNLYSTSHPALTAEPATVLADGVDLFAYPTLGELQTFTAADARTSGLPAPGPLAGFAFANGKLYVRLNARYGSQNPATHSMKVSPPRAGGYRGDVIQSPTDYNWSVQTATAAYVILDGFTFESPGYAGVWIQFGNVTVRNCTFLGCRTGVRGWGAAESQPLATQISADVIVQGCEFSQYPAWQDMLDVVATAEALTPTEQAALPTFFWWTRKGGPRTSEIGLTTSAGLRWKILGNYIHDTIDGLSFLAVGWSDQCEIAYNRFEKLIDNAIETENHAQHLRAHHNFVRDVFEPFSYQPNAGAPYPASIWFYRNIVTLTPEGTGFFKKPILKWVPSCCKIKPSGSTFNGVGLDGLIFFNNTLHFPSGNLLSLNTAGASAGSVKFFNNIVIADQLQTEVTSPSFTGYTFVRNCVAPATAGQPGPGSIAAGASGHSYASAASLGLKNIAATAFAPVAGSPAIGSGAVHADLPGSSVDAGALPVAPQFQRFDEWRFHYFYDHLFDPAVSAAADDPEGDTLGNVLECLLSRDPLRCDIAGATAASLAAGRLQLDFTHRQPLPEDVAWSVEASGDLIAWASGSGVTETLAPTAAGSGLQTEHVRDLTGTPLRALRLRATQLDLPPGPVPIFDTPPTSNVGNLIIDGFTDGGRSNGADAADAAWFTILPPSGGTQPALSIVDDTAGLGSGNALFINNVTAQSQSKTIVASYVKETLATAGDKLTLSFDFRFGFIAANDVANHFRFGLYDDNGKPYTADNQFIVPPASSGYMASINFGAIGSVPALLREAGTGSTINADNDIVTVGNFGATAFAVPASAVKYSAILTLTKTAGGVSFHLQLLNSTGTSLLDQTVTDPAPQTTSNLLIFSTSQSEADYYLDNVLLNFTPAGG